MGTEVEARPARRGWPLQADFAVIAVLLLLLGVAAGTFVHFRSMQEAKEAALADANLAAQRTAREIQRGFDTFQELTTPLAGSAAVGEFLTDPSGCSLSYGPVGTFSTGHLDIVRADGTVVCTSLKGRPVTYAGEAWLRATTPMVVAPVIDRATGNQVAVYAYPIAHKGFVTWSLDLTPLGPQIGSEYGSGTHKLEFLITSPDGSAIIARSASSAKWTGAKVAGTPFASATDPVNRSDVEGKRRWYAEANVDGPGWKVYVGADQAAALADAAGLQNEQSLGQLAGGVAHDFNNLLGVILNFALFAKEKVLAAAGETPSDDLQQAVKDIERVVRAGESAGRLTHQLLAFARREVMRPQSLDVNSVVAELQPLVGRTIGEHIDFVTSPGKDLWPALMDPGQLEQVLTNLVVNARDAMPNGGKLIIDCENVYVDEAYAAGRPGLKPGRYVRIRVTDTGTGMDATTLRRVFEPFFTTKPGGQGTGLGLATVHGIVHQAGGDISIYSEVGTGTRVHVLLPAADEAPKPAEDEAPKPRKPVSATVLVVEDADDLRDITELILKKVGYRVLTAPNGLAALEAAKNHAGIIDLLLTDVVMPQMHGPDLAKRILASRPEIQILFMSGYAQPMVGGGDALEDGVLLIEKPFTEPVLLDAIEHALHAPRAVAAL